MPLSTNDLRWTLLVLKLDIVATLSLVPALRVDVGDFWNGEPVELYCSLWGQHRLRGVRRLLATYWALRAYVAPSSSQRKMRRALWYRIKVLRAPTGDSWSDVNIINSQLWLVWMKLVVAMESDPWGQPWERREKSRRSIYLERQRLRRRQETSIDETSIITWWPSAWWPVSAWRPWNPQYHQWGYITEGAPSGAEDDSRSSATTELGLFWG